MREGLDARLADQRLELRRREIADAEVTRFSLGERVEGTPGLDVVEGRGFGARVDRTDGPVHEIEI